ncbi:phenylalanine--tRNA ligase subunit beta [Chloroflexota bacterium]
MKVSLNWLKDYIKISLPPKELAHKLTMAGAEVGGLGDASGKWDNILIGQIKAVNDHPNAERLKLATISLAEESITVVCGAPNLEVGQKVPFAHIGANLIDVHSGKSAKLKPAKIRGVRSEGMVCSEKELGISDQHEGIMTLPPDAPIGKPLSEYLGDTVFDLKITPNRPDCLSVIGVARELAALTGEHISIPNTNYDEQSTSVQELVSVEIHDPDLCPRYCASLVTGVKIGPSPSWIQQRLLASGMRPINNVVDITNYVMLEYGQPLHAFDFPRLRGGKIIVRRAKKGEVMFSLDGVERILDPDMLVIADAKEPIAIAGIMGGSESEVTEETTSILLESANFNHTSIRYTSANLRLRSEASIRFDKSLSPELSLPALRRATSLFIEIAEGKAARGIIDVYPGKTEKDPVLLPIERVSQVLGVELPTKRIVEVLNSLGFTSEPEDTTISVTVPYWRTDIRLADDLVEEIARIIGYDELPATMLHGETPQQEPAPLLGLKERISDLLAGCGMQEIITYSLVSQAMLAKINPNKKPALKLANPLTLEQEYLRTSLRGGLLTAFSANARHEDNSIMLFEVGKVYSPKENDLPEEREMLAGVIGGPRIGQSCHQTEGGLDFFDTKGILEAVLNRLGLKPSFEPAEDLNFLPGRTAEVLVGGKQVGVLGEVHPKLADSFDIHTIPLYLFEVDLQELLLFSKAIIQYQPIPRFPGITRDIAVIVDTQLTASRIEGIIHSSPLIAEVTIFDVYSGEQIPQGKKSLAFSILYQSPTHTLTAEEVDKTHQAIIARLKREIGATLRG